jgi:hypothetical protein
MSCEEEDRRFLKDKTEKNKGKKEVVTKVNRILKVIINLENIIERVTKREQRSNINKKM